MFLQTLAIATSGALAAACQTSAPAATSASASDPTSPPSTVPASTAAPAAGASSATGAPTPAAPLPTVRAVYTEITENRLPLWLGTDQNIFDTYGTHVESTFIASTPTAVASLLAGDVDVIEASAGDFISAISKGAQLKAIGLVAQGTEYQLWVKPDIQTPQDLAGKRIAVSKLGSASYIWVKAMLDAMHAPSDAMHAPSDVTLVPTGDTNSSYAAFLSDAVQGYATTPVNRIGEDPSNAHPLGDAAALGVSSAGHFLAVKSDYLQSHRDVLVKFLTGYAVATQVSYSNEGLAMQTYAAYLQKTDPDYLKGVFETYVHFPPDQGGMPLDPTPTVDLMQKQIELQEQADTTIQPDQVVATSIEDASLMQEVTASPIWQQLWPTGVPSD